MAVGTTDSLAGEVDAVGGEVGCEQATSAHVDMAPNADLIIKVVRS